MWRQSWPAWNLVRRQYRQSPFALNSWPQVLWCWRPSLLGWRPSPLVKFPYKTMLCLSPARPQSLPLYMSSCPDVAPDLHEGDIFPVGGMPLELLLLDALRPCKPWEDLHNIHYIWFFIDMCTAFVYFRFFCISHIKSANKMLLQVRTLSPIYIYIYVCVCVFLNQYL